MMRRAFAFNARWLPLVAVSTVAVWARHGLLATVLTAAAGLLVAVILAWRGTRADRHVVDSWRGRAGHELAMRHALGFNKRWLPFVIASFAAVYVNDGLFFMLVALGFGVVLTLSLAWWGTRSGRRRSSDR